MRAPPASLPASALGGWPLSQKKVCEGATSGIIRFVCAVDCNERRYHSETLQAAADLITGD